MSAPFFTTTALKPPKTMIILTLHRLKFNKEKVKKNKPIIINGPLDIPEGHSLFGKKLYRWGHYTRNLVLLSGKKIKVVVQRFYCPKTKRTFSLLPFYISRYQRYINTLIEDVLVKRIIDGKSCDKIAASGPPLCKTIARWTREMRSKLESLRAGIKKYLIRRNAEYFSVDTPKNTIAEKFSGLLDDGNALASAEDILQYGALSYIKYVLQEDMS